MQYDNEFIHQMSLEREPKVYQMRTDCFAEVAKLIMSSDSLNFSFISDSADSK